MTLRQITFTISGGDRSVELCVANMDDSDTNFVKQAAQSGTLRLSKVEYEAATKTKKREWRI